MTDQVNYFFNFPSRTRAFLDPIVGPYLAAQTPGLDTLSVYDLRQGGVQTLPSYWCGIIAPYNPTGTDFLVDDFGNVLTTDAGDPLTTDLGIAGTALLTSPYLQFVVDRSLQVSAGDGSGVIVNNISPELLFNLQIVSPYGGYVTSGLHP